MNIGLKLLAGAAAIAGVAAPAAAQYYPQPAPQPYAYPQQPYAYPQQGYPQQQQGYGYQQQGGIAGIINQLLGNRYNAPDRTAVTQCAAAAQSQAAAQYRPRSGYQYGQYGQYQGQQGYNGYNAMQSARVTGITNVERRRNGLRVSGTMSSGLNAAYGQPGYGQGNAYGTPYGQNAYNPAYAAQASDLTFRCNVDYRGVVTDVRVRRNTAYGRR